MIPSIRSVCTVGQGALGTALGLALDGAGFQILRASQRKGFDIIWDSDRLTVPAVDVLFLCLPDDVLASACRRLIFKSPVTKVIHLSGSLGLKPLEVLQETGRGVGALHILQTFNGGGGASLFNGAFASVLAPDPDVRSMLMDIAATIGLHPFEVSESDKMRLHAAAVLVSNFLVILADGAVTLSQHPDLPDIRKILSKLMRQTVDNITSLDENRPTLSVLSGPVRRGDGDTINRHLGLLKPFPDLLDAYMALSRMGVNGLEREHLAEPKHFNIMELLHAPK